MNRRPGQVERAIEAIKWVIGVGGQSGPHRLVLDPQQKYSVPIASKYPSHEGLSYELICRLIYGVFHSKHPFSRDTPPFPFRVSLHCGHHARDQLLNLK
jgi:hypothetical protein